MNRTIEVSLLIRFLTCVTVVNFLFGCESDSNEIESTTSSKILVSGAMHNVMHQGELAGIISLDTITARTGLYGLGPVEYLQGELLILDGQTYVSTVGADSSMTVQQQSSVKAPFFVYGNQTEWNIVMLPDSVRTLFQLEGHMNAVAQTMTKPFVFKLNGLIEQAAIHVQNLAAGTAVSSPAEAHQGQVDYELKDVEADIVGFYSTEHKGIFTHHDSNMHLHLITADRKMMGHLDAVIIKPGTTLYLPK